ncbi:MAG: glycosyltransferase family 9 protein [Selenomonas ruminantium]|nr:glycosyltransferase family 9 protein [Selenomonas ruminantium]
MNVTEERQNILSAVRGYQEAHKEDKVFVAKDLVETLEPLFERYGYRRRKGPREVQRILVLRDDAAGDFVLNSPFMRELRRIYPKAHITLFASKRNDEIARCCPYIDNIIVNEMTFKQESIWEVLGKLGALAAEHLLSHHFDMAFSGRLGIRSADVILMYLSGARERIAYTQDRPMGGGKIARIGWDVMLTLPVPLQSKIESDVDRNLFMLEYMLRLPIADRHLEAWFLNTEGEAAVKLLAPLKEREGCERIYAIMPGASESFKQWPVERFRELLEEILRREPGTSLAVLGGPDDKDKAQLLSDAFPGRAICLAGKLPFRMSLAVLSLCQKYIGSDTGLMHMASAMKVPILTVFPYPASLGFFPMSCPVRFQPYEVPSVVLLPPEPADERCRLINGTGCANKEGRAHCILGVTVPKMLEGYELLERRIAEKKTGAVLMK